MSGVVELEHWSTPTCQLDQWIPEQSGLMHQMPISQSSSKQFMNVPLSECNCADVWWPPLMSHWPRPSCLGANGKWISCVWRTINRINTGHSGHCQGDRRVSTMGILVILNKERTSFVWQTLIVFTRWSGDTWARVRLRQRAGDNWGERIRDGATGIFVLPSKQGQPD